MDAQELLGLGFTIVAGQIDKDNVNYGQLLATGALLTPEGEQLVLQLRKPAEPEVTADPAPRRGRKPAEASE